MPSVMSRVLKLMRAEIEQRVSDLEARAAKRQEGRASSKTKGNGSWARWGNETRWNNDAPRENPRLARYYSNLEVPYGSDLETVRASWKRLVRKYHPDLHGTDPEKQRIATELVKGLNHAFEELRKHLEKSA